GQRARICRFRHRRLSRTEGRRGLLLIDRLTSTLLRNCPDLAPREESTFSLAKLAQLFYFCSCAAVLDESAGCPIRRSRPEAYRPSRSIGAGTGGRGERRGEKNFLSNCYENRIAGENDMHG